MTEDSLRTQARKFLDPNRPFVGRGDELALVRQKVESAFHGGPIQSGVLCFYGPFGMGKSWLTMEIQRRFQRVDFRSEAGNFPSIVVHVDFDNNCLKSIKEDGHISHKTLIYELWKPLADQMQENLPDLEDISGDSWADAFVEKVTVWSVASATPVIVMDTMDDLIKTDPKTFSWLEERVIERLAMTDRILFILTSRGELSQLKRFQVRRRMLLLKLKPFTCNETGNALQIENPFVQQTLFHHAFGHPLMTEKLGTELERKGLKLQKIVDISQELKPEIVRSVLKAVVKVILENVSEIDDLIRCMSVIRWIDPEPMQWISETLGLTEPGLGEDYYTKLMDNLQAQHVLYWNNAQKHSIVDPVLRHLIAHLFELDHPFQFYEAHLAAYKFYCQHLEQDATHLTPYLLELAYHRVILARDPQRNAELPNFLTWLNRFTLERENAKLDGWERRWQEFRQKLEEDTEIKDLLPNEMYQELLSKAKNQSGNLC